MNFEHNRETIDIIKADMDIPDKVQQRIDDTLAGLEQKPGRATRRRLKKLAIAAAACIMAVPTVAFAAYISGENSAFYQAIFGRGSRSSIEEQVEYDQDGKISLNLPNIERVDVDDQQAEELVGAYVKAVDTEYELKSYRGHTTKLTIHRALFDSDTGIFQAYLSLEQAGGIPDLQVSPDGECYFTGNGLLLYGSASPGRLYYDAANSTDDKAYLTAVGVAGADAPQTMVFGEYIPQEELQPEDAAKHMDGLSNDLAVVDFAALAESLPNIQAGEAINVNALGMRLDLAALGFTDANDDYPLKYIAIEYAGGEKYILRDRATNTESIDYAITHGPQYEGDATKDVITTYCFNRLVNLNEVESVNINGQEYSII